MYSMWNNSFYSVLKHKQLKCLPMAFNTSDRGIVTKFKIEELDALTSVYKDEDEFYKQLLKYGDTYIKGNYKGIIITHTKNGIIYQDEPIYNDKMIRDMANEIRTRKKEKSPKKRVLLSNSEVLLEFIDYIKGLALNDHSYKYLLEPLLIEKNVSDEDKIILQNLIRDDVVNSQGKIIYHGLRNLLSQYRLYYNTYYQCIRLGEDIFDVANNLSKVEERINYTIRSDYRTLRNLVAWESQYLKVLQKQKDFITSQSEYEICFDLIQEVMFQKDFRNEKLSYEGLRAFYRDREMLSIPISCQDKNIEDEEMLMFYQQGGIDEVMKNISIDEIYTSKAKYQDALKLGIVKEKK